MRLNWAWEFNILWAGELVTIRSLEWLAQSGEPKRSVMMIML